jgi:hypothetical protein
MNQAAPDLTRSALPRLSRRIKPVEDRTTSDRPVAVDKRAIILFIGLAAVMVLMISCVTIPFATNKREVRIRLYPHAVSSEGGINYHALCEIYERSRDNEIRSSLFNNAAIQVNGYGFLLDEGFIETHRGEQYEDYIVDGRFLYIGDELVLDSGEEVRIQMVHPKIGRIERTLIVPMSVREVRVDGNQLASWLAGDATALGIRWTGEPADRYRIVVLASLHDGQTERTHFDAVLQETQIERSQLNLPSGFDFASHELEIEIIASNTLEFEVERVQFNWTIESPFASRLTLN